MFRASERKGGVGNNCNDIGIDNFFMYPLFRPNPAKVLTILFTGKPYNYLQLYSSTAVFIDMN